MYSAVRAESYRSAGDQGPGGPRDPTRFLLGVRGCSTETYLLKCYKIHRDALFPQVGGRGTRYSVRLPLHLVTSAQSQKDKFETLCYVEADISSAPFTSKYTTTGRMSYRRDADIILLVGLTELKAQVGWIDSKTVRAHVILHVAFIHLTQPPHA